METDEERKARLEKISYHTAQVGPGDRGRKKNTNKIIFHLDLIGLRLEFSKTKIFRNQLAHPVMGTIFLVSSNYVLFS